MQLIAQRIERTRGGLTHAVGAVRAPQDARAGLLLTLFDDEGRAGQGEASPLPGYSRESLDECEAVLRRVCREMTAWRFQGESLGALGCLLRGYHAELEAVPAARFALETALLDLLAQRARVGVRALLGAPPEGVVPRNASLGAALDADLAHRARAALDAGASTVKVKVGAADFPSELAALRALRTLLGRSITLRLDANGAWTPAEARARVEALAALSPEFVEEPVSGHALLELGVLPVPWAVDESLRDPALAAALLGDDPRPRQGCAAVVLKPTTLGGLLASLSLGKLAISRGLRVVVTHCFDGPVALAAACELALAFGPHSVACGLDPHPGLAVWPRVSIPQLAAPGMVIPSTLPGLGLPRLSPLDVAVE